MAPEQISFTIDNTDLGCPRPRAMIRMPAGTHFRKTHAVLLRFAAAVELATPASERWTVGIYNATDEKGWVYLELAKGATAEADRGLRVLRAVGTSLATWR